MRRIRLLFGSLAARLFFQTVALSVVPMLVVAVAVLSIAAGVIRVRLAAEGDSVAERVSADLLQQAESTSRNAAVLAQLPALGSMTESNDQARLTAFISTERSQLGLDAIAVSDLRGSVIASAPAVELSASQALAADSGIAQTSPPWVLTDDPRGMMLRARSPIQGIAGESVGALELGVLVDASFLRARQADAHEDLVLIGNHQSRASTEPSQGFKLPESQSRKTQTIDVDGARYLVASQPVASNTDEPVTLVVLTPLSAIPSMTRSLWLLLSGLILLIGVAIVWLTRRMVRSVIAPFQRLVSALLRVKGGDLRAQVPATSQSEIAGLEVAFNKMVSSLEQRHAERAGHVAELSYRASHDSLTGLPNRNRLQSVLDSAVTEARRGRPSVLMYLDFDQFKLVNDTLGHESGDRLLALLAELLRTALREQDVLVRLGGDEFAVLLPNVRLAEAEETAERLRRVVNDFRFTEQEQSFALGVSVGMTPITPLVSASEALRQADVACYEAKVDGRNRVKVYAPDGDTLALMADDALWTVELKDALEANRLRLVFQPIVRLQGRAIDHYETLVRLEGRDGDLIRPPAFLPAAERSGLIRDIDHWVLNAALDRMQRENASGNPVRLAMNVSASTLDSPNASDLICAAIESKRIDPRTLTFEIGEGALWTGGPKRHQTIELLREFGCSIALDRFGAETSSFAHLSQLPVDSIKIDGSFVRDVDTNSINRSIVRAIALIIHSFGKSITAEWVENSETLTILRRLRVDLAQGHFIGYPSNRLGASPSVPRMLSARKDRSRPRVKVSGGPR